MIRYTQMTENSMSTPVNWLALCASLAAGEACGFAASRFAALWPAAALLLGAVSLALLAAGARGVRFFVVFAAGFVLALHAAHIRGEAIADATWRNCGTPFARVFRVESVSRSPYGGATGWTSFCGVADNLKVRVVFQLPEGATPPRRGESWMCAGWLDRPRPAARPRMRKLWVRGAGTYARRIDTPRGAFAALLWSARDDLSRRMGLGLPDGDLAANLNRAILLGERSLIPKEERDAFIAAGTIHVFAISGLHVMLVAGSISLLLAVCGVPVRAAGLVLIPALWLYVAMTGSSPSAVRAASMASINSLAPMFWRRQNGLVAWSATFLAVYALDPTKLHDTGCALSFAVMLGVVVWGRFASDFIKSRLLSAVATSLAAWAAAVPIAAHAFGRVTPGGIVANLALLPAAGASVKAALAGILASFFSDRLAAHANNLAALVARAMSGVSGAVATIPGANLEVVPWSATACVAWYAAFALALLLLRRFLSRRHRTL